MTGRAWGAWVGGSPSDAAAFESLVGKKMHMQMLFADSTDGFPQGFDVSLRDQGKTMAVFWETNSVTLDDIIAGRSDTAIRNFAVGAKTYGGKVIFLPFHEMNGSWSKWGATVGTNTPEKLIAAWRHVHGFFADVPNVKFGWAVNNVSVPDTTQNTIGAYYPGDAYVDYVGVDGFNFGNPWQTFDAVFRNALQQVRPYNKPIYLFSMASAPGSQKAAWITDAFTTQMQNHPDIVGWMWFNENKEKDWRVNSDPASLAAFKAILP